jgi:hypothetical protein
MAHFLALVLVEAGDPDPIARAERMMAAYWVADLADRARKPEARCDGFVVGGRYDGIIWGKEQHHDLSPDEFRRRYGLDVVRPEDNVRPVAQLVPELLPYAIVTPVGGWVDRGGESVEGWRGVVDALLARHREHLAVAIDCHC